MAYDQILGSDITAIELVFPSITSPFLPFIKDFVTYELKFSSPKLKELQTEIDSVILTFNDKGLRSSVELIAKLVTKIFSITKASMSRFEIFNCGCRSLQFVEAIDSMISNYISEMSIALSTIAASLISRNNDNIDNFDEEDVQTLLELLKIAGQLSESLSSFGSFTQERFRSLLTGIETSAKQESEGMPDSLSMGEVGVLIARITLSKNEDKKNISDLERTLDNSTSVTLKSSHTALQHFVETCRKLVFDECFVVPGDWLKAIPDLPDWVKEDNGDNDIIDSYSTLPQPYITHVGEHILALVQVLEPFASSNENLFYAKKVMNDVNVLSRGAWSELASLLGCVDDTSHGEDVQVINSIMSGENLPDYVRTIDYLNSEEEDDESHASDEGHMFCNEWLQVVSTALVGRLLERILRIQKLSSKGLEHLSTDLNYIENVFSALGIDGHPHPLLHHLSYLVGLGEDDFEAYLRERHTSTTKMDEAIQMLESRLANIRRN